MERQIFYHDTDVGGVVYYANYLKYMEESRTEELEALGIDKTRFLYAVRQCVIKYKNPARYGDRIRCTADIVKVTAAQIIFDQKVINKADDRILVEAEVTLVCLNHDFKPVAIPDDVRELLTK